MCDCKSKTGLGGGTTNAIFEPVCASPEISQNKVAIIGGGKVGVTTAVTLVCKAIAIDLAIVDTEENRTKGHALDIEQANTYFPGKIQASSSYDIIKGAKVTVICAGLAPKADQSTKDVLKENTDIINEIVPKVIQNAPDTILVIVTEPVDVLTQLAWKLSGLPKHKVFGTGCIIDTSRLRSLIAEQLDVPASTVEAYIIGEHGDSAVVLWSHITVSGVKLAELNPKIGADDDPENWKELKDKALKSNSVITGLKGYTNWAISFCISAIIDACLNNTQLVLPLSVYAKDTYGIQEEAFLSLPVALGQDGITSIIKLKLSPEEEEQLRKSAKSSSNACKC